MDMMVLMLLMFMLPNLLNGLGGFFQGNTTPQAPAPNIYITGSGGTGGPPLGDKDTSYVATYDPTSGGYVYVPQGLPDEDIDDSPFDLAILGGIMGGAAGALIAPMTLGLSIPAGAIIGAGAGFIADMFI